MNDLRLKLVRFMSEYESELNEARETDNYKRPFGTLVRQEITSHIEAEVDKTIYKVKGSVGAGRWTDVPWIAVFDKRITTSAQKGVYIVYLLNKETKSLFLTLNQGATDVSQRQDGTGPEKLAFTGISSSDNKKTISALKERAESIRTIIGNTYQLKYNEINTGSKAYDAGCIFYKEYTPETLPEDKKIYADLHQFIELYSSYYINVYLKGNEEETVNKLPKERNNHMDISVKDNINLIKNYISSQGFSYNNNLIENLFLSLKSKPFVILAGTSGTGKTRLAKLFSQAIGAHYLMIPVRPDWSDSSDLFGHLDLKGKFIPGPILSFICEAQNNQTESYILCLDEMNLARVEYYLSDILSVIETRDWYNGVIESDLLIKKERFGDDREALALFGEIEFPPNLYLIGTVNMDETTFPFSKKVLDRANTIEFSYVDLIPDFTTESPDGEDKKTVHISNDFLKSEYLVLARDCTDSKEYITHICGELQRINEILVRANLHIGYRVRDEIVFYMLNNKEAGELITSEQAFDNEIMQKILPRIQGSSSAIKDMLVELFKYCMDDYSGLDTESGNSGIQMQTIAASGKYPESAKKIGYMMTRYEEDGFTSYWL